MVFDENEQEIENYKQMLRESYAESRKINNTFFAWAFLSDLDPEHRAQLQGNLDPEIKWEVEYELDP